MENNALSTLELIHQAAKTEFMEKGYLSASLRNIVKNAGVTTGAFYGYYKSKEELFDALVEKHANYIFAVLDQHMSEFNEIPVQEQSVQMSEISNSGIGIILDYLYQYKDEFKLLLLYSDGTRYSEFVHQLVEKEARATKEYMNNLNEMEHTFLPISDDLIHMISSGFFTGILETVIHDMPKEEAKKYVAQLSRFYTAGWSELFGVKL